MLHILRHARGRYGTTLEYLAETAHALRKQGVRDREIERLMQLAAHHGLV
jgi:glutathione-specific gamma-glutamylcyclotransferase